MINEALEKILPDDGDAAVGVREKKNCVAGADTDEIARTFRDDYLPFLAHGDRGSDLPRRG